MSTVSAPLTRELLQELLAKQSESLLEAIAKLLQTVPGASAALAAALAPVSAAPGRQGRGRRAAGASADPSAPPKPKREANVWIKFTMRVENLVRQAEDAAETAKESRMRTMAIKQYASHLKSQKPYAEWSDDEIQSGLPLWTPPETSKRAAAAAAEGSADGSSVASAPAKKRGGWSEETKAAAAVKRAATKAAKQAAAGAVPASAVAAASAAVPATAPAAPPPSAAPKKATVKPKVDLRFRPWTHEGEDYYKNGRGDVISTDMEWVGRWDGSTLDEEADEPEDLSQAEVLEE